MLPHFDVHLCVHLGDSRLDLVLALEQLTRHHVELLEVLSQDSVLAGLVLRLRCLHLPAQIELQVVKSVQIDETLNSEQSLLLLILI